LNRRRDSASKEVMEKHTENAQTSSNARDRDGEKFRLKRGISVKGGKTRVCPRRGHRRELKHKGKELRTLAKSKRLGNKLYLHRNEREGEKGYNKRDGKTVLRTPGNVPRLGKRRIRITSPVNTRGLFGG